MDAALNSGTPSAGLELFLRFIFVASKVRIKLLSGGLAFLGSDDVDGVGTHVREEW